MKNMILKSKTMILQIGVRSLVYTARYHSFLFSSIISFQLITDKEVKWLTVQSFTFEDYLKWSSGLSMSRLPSWLLLGPGWDKTGFWVISFTFLRCVSNLFSLKAKKEVKF